MDVLIELRGLRDRISKVDRLEKHAQEILFLEELITLQFGENSRLLRQIEEARSAKFVAVGDVGWDSGVKHMQEVSLQVVEAAIALLEKKIKSDESRRQSEEKHHQRTMEIMGALEQDMDLARAAIVCENGHLIAATESEGAVKGYCRDCGGRRLRACQCGAAIPGQTYRERDQNLPFRVPSFCTECGAPQIWTQRHIASILEVAELAEGISEREREMLAKNLELIIRETPEAVSAAQKVKLIAMKSSKELATTILRMAVDYASSQARSVLLGA